MKDIPTPPDLVQARGQLTEWLLICQRRVASRNHSVSAQIEAKEIDRRLPAGVMISVEAWDEALNQTYCELYAGMARHGSWGIDQEYGVVSRRAVRRLARDRLSDRIRDHLTRRREANREFVIYAARLDQPVEQAKEDGAEPPLRAEVTGDERVDVPRQVINRDLIEQIRRRPRRERAVLLGGPLLDLGDEELGRALAEPPARLRKRRQRLRRELISASSSRRRGSAHRNG